MSEEVMNKSKTGAINATVFEIFTHKDRKLLILPTSPLFDARARGNLLEFLADTAKVTIND